MLRLVIGMSNSLPEKLNNKGFTLVEILVVLLIIGITIGFALLAFGDFGAKRRAIFSAEQFVNYVKLVQQQAILETSTLGILVQQNQYEVFRFGANMNWQAFPVKSIFRKYAFPSDVSVRFQPSMNTGGTPQIIINESGDMNPFRLMIEIKGTRALEMIGQHNGLITLKTT